MTMAAPAGRLAGRVAMVTGGGQGLGKAYVTRLVADGAKVVAVDIAADAVEAVASSLPGVIGVRGDVRSFADLKRAADAGAEQFGTLDILVNKAGGGLVPRKPIAEMTAEHWNLVFDVNLKGAWLASRAVTPYMKQRNWGRIINVASAGVHASRSRRNENTPYIAAKSGVIGLTRVLARELAPYNVTVNVIAPGATAVNTPKLSRPPEELRARFAEIVRDQVVQRPERPEDLASVVAFLASDESEFISGQLINVDGGWTMP
jgi:3-oxoacyl-[acyl-carrier protein] reductase